MAWTVTSTSPGLGPGPNGIPVTGLTVVFDLDTGQTGQLFVPDSVKRQGAEAVKAMIAQEAALLAGIKGLSG